MVGYAESICKVLSVLLKRPSIIRGGGNTLFFLRLGDVCLKVCPVGDGCRTNICPGDGGGAGNAQDILDTNLFCGWRYL